MNGPFQDAQPPVLESVAGDVLGSGTPSGWSWLGLAHALTPIQETLTEAVSGRGGAVEDGVGVFGASSARAKGEGFGEPGGREETQAL